MLAHRKDNIVRITLECAAWILTATDLAEKIKYVLKKQFIFVQKNVVVGHTNKCEFSCKSANLLKS